MAIVSRDGVFFFFFFFLTSFIYTGSIFGTYTGVPVFKTVQSSGLHSSEFSYKFID